MDAEKALKEISIHSCLSVLTKCIFEKYTANIILKGERLILPKIRNKIRTFVFSISIQHYSGGSTQENQKEIDILNGNKTIPIHILNGHCVDSLNDTHS